MPEHHRAQVRVGILAIAIGVVGIVMAMVIAASHDMFKENSFNTINYERLLGFRPMNARAGGIQSTRANNQAPFLSRPIVGRRPSARIGQVHRT